MSETKLGGRFTFPGTSLTVHRMGYGAMQLSGPGIFGPPKDPDEAVAVLREAIESGVDHIDTSDFYGPHVTNQIIRQALHPYPEGLVIVTKLGAVRGEDASWQPAHGKDDLIAGVHDNLRNLGLDALDVVNLRVGGMLEPTEGPIADKVEVLADLQRQGLIRHVGLSNVTAAQVAEAQAITEIVCVQNLLQPGPPQRRRPDRRPGQAGHPLRAVLPARRVHAAPIVHPVGRRGPPRSHADAGRAGMAAAPLAQHPADPRHVVARPPPREPGRGPADACLRKPWRSWTGSPPLRSTEAIESPTCPPTPRSPAIGSWPRPRTSSGGSARPRRPSWTWPGHWA